MDKVATEHLAETSMNIILVAKSSPQKINMISLGNVSEFKA